MVLIYEMRKYPVNKTRANPGTVCPSCYFQRSNLTKRLFPASTIQMVPPELAATPTGNPNASSSGPYWPKAAKGAPDDENTITRYRSGSVIYTRSSLSTAMYGLLSSESPSQPCTG